MNVLFGIAHLKKKELGNDNVGHHVIDRGAEKNNAVHEQARVNVVAPLAAPRLFDHMRNQEILHNQIVRKISRRNLTKGHQGVKATPEESTSDSAARKELRFMSAMGC